MAPGNGLRFGLGPFTGQGVPSDRRRMVEAHRSILGLAEQAEALGFDSVWVSEHHFTPDGYLGALFPLLGALTAVTERVVLGTRVALAPLYHPLRLAEDAAEVALLGRGRLILGLGSGYHQHEFDAFGVSLGERRHRMVETVETCRSAWSGEPFVTKGQPGETRLQVLPAPPEPPELWLGGRARAAVRRAAALADGYVAPLGGADDTRQLLDVLDGARPPDAPQLPVASSMLVAVEGVAGGEAAKAAIVGVLETYRGLTGEGAGAPRNQGVAIGDPDQVARTLQAKAAVVGVGRLHHLVVRLAHPGMEVRDVEAQMRAFAADVIPRLQADAVVAVMAAKGGDR